MSATYAKLKNGDWGIRVTGPAPKAGDTVTVSKRDGSTKQETVAAVLWTGDGVSLCSLRAKQSSSGGRGGVCAECGRGGPLVRDLEDGLPKHYRCCDIPPG